MKILVTGAAGFIGYHVAARLLAEGCKVTGLDNLNSYYDPSLKRARLARLQTHRNLSFCSRIYWIGTPWRLCLRARISTW